MVNISQKLKTYIESKGQNVNSGVYCIYNKITGCFYIGSSGTLKERLYDHRYDLEKNRHYATRLQNSWNSRKPEDFLFKVLMTCEPERCLEFEQYYINALDPEYNTCKIAGSCLGVKRSDETKLKLSQALKGRSFSIEHKSNISKARKGIIISKETRLQISNTLKGRIFTEEHILNLKKARGPRTLTDETRLKMSNSSKKRDRSHQNKSVLKMSRTDNKIVKEYKSITDASLDSKISVPCIVFAAKGKTKTAGGFKWKYKDDRDK